MTKKFTEKRINGYGHVERRHEGHMLRIILDAPVPGKRRRGRQKTRWKDSCKRDTESVWLKEDILNRTKRNIMIFMTIPATPGYGKSPTRRRRM